MNAAPKPKAGTFPPSWKRWRMLKVGEKIRATDRVLSPWVFTNDGVKKKTTSMQMYKRMAGSIVSDGVDNKPFPVGWYYRKVQ